MQNKTTAAIVLLLLTGLVAQNQRPGGPGDNVLLKRSLQMRKLFLIASVLICLTSVNAFAQETPSAQKPTAETELPKNAVDKALDDAKERGEKVLGGCLMDCEGVAITEGVESGHGVELPAPAYPPIARAAHAAGTVEVKVIVDTDGSISAAVAISGHPLLQAAAVGAARKARFTPWKYKGEPVKIVGIIQYNFVAQ